MTKKDLKSGMVVELRNGERYLFNGVVLINFEGYMIMAINYSQDLRSKHYREQDIVKVYKSKPNSLRTIFQDKYLTMIWDRKNMKLTDEEIEILKALKTLHFDFLARDKDYALNAYGVAPYKNGDVWDFVGYDVYQSIGVDSDLFDFIAWEDEDATYIDDLLQKLENEKREEV